LGRSRPRSRADKAENSFFLRASQNWLGALDELAWRANSIHDEIVQARPDHYDWSLYQSEWTTDVLFTSPATLADVYPRHVMVHCQSPDVICAKSSIPP
jgi:hypothetical protein